jgi:hypothetical protein
LELEFEKVSYLVSKSVHFRVGKLGRILITLGMIRLAHGQMKFCYRQDIPKRLVKPPGASHDLAEIFRQDMPKRPLVSRAVSHFHTKVDLSRILFPPQGAERQRVPRAVSDSHKKIGVFVQHRFRNVSRMFQFFHKVFSIPHTIR